MCLRLVWVLTSENCLLTNKFFVTQTGQGESVADDYNNLDSQKLELSLEILDDFMGEAEVVDDES